MVFLERGVHMGKIMNKREDKLMHLLWRQKESVSIDDMQKKITDEKISKATLFKAVQSLYKKGYIKVTGFEQTTNTYARMFKAAISPEEYDVIVVRERGINLQTMDGFMVAMLGSDFDLDDEDEKWIREEMRKVREHFESKNG